MERLTERFDGWVMRKWCHGPCRTCNRVECADIYTMIDHLAAYEDTGLEPEEVVQTKLALMGKVLAEVKEFDGVPVNRMIELAQAEKDGRLVVLPCKPGQTIWVESCIRGRVTDIATPDIAWIIENTERFGKEIFLTREEAEVAMKKREETI